MCKSVTNHENLLKSSLYYVNLFCTRPRTSKFRWIQMKYLSAWQGKRQTVVGVNFSEHLNSWKFQYCNQQHRFVSVKQNKHICVSLFTFGILCMSKINVAVIFISCGASIIFRTMQSFKENFNSYGCQLFRGNKEEFGTVIMNKSLNLL